MFNKGNKAKTYVRISEFFRRSLQKLIVLQIQLKCATNRHIETGGWKKFIMTKHQFHSQIHAISSYNDQCNFFNTSGPYFWENFKY